MKVLRIDHVALVVTDLEEAKQNFIEKLGAEYIMEISRADTKYTAVYTAWGDPCNIVK